MIPIGWSPVGKKKYKELCACGMAIIPRMMEKHLNGNIHKKLMEAVVDDSQYKPSMVRCVCRMLVPIKSLERHQRGKKC